MQPGREVHNPESREHAHERGAEHAHERGATESRHIRRAGTCAHQRGSRIPAGPWPLRWRGSPVMWRQESMTGHSREHAHENPSAFEKSPSFPKQLCLLSTNCLHRYGVLDFNNLFSGEKYAGEKYMYTENCRSDHLHAAGHPWTPGTRAGVRRWALGCVCLHAVFQGGVGVRVSNGFSAICLPTYSGKEGQL